MAAGKEASKSEPVRVKTEPVRLKAEPVRVPKTEPVRAKGESGSEPEPEIVKPERKTKNVGKIASGKRLACHAGASAWRTACLELGYLTQGVSKKLPKKGTAEYSKLKKLQDEKIRADPLNR